MSAPFGDHPLLGHYLQWAREQGCEVSSGIDHETMTPLIKIVRPDKLRAVIEVNVDQEEHLLPTQIGYYDRALGLRSPWFSLDNEEEGQRR